MPSDSIRVTQNALARAGSLHLGRVLDKANGETLSSLLKGMAEHSALASGRSRNRNPKAPRSPVQRRRYGDFILILKANRLLDVVAIRKDWCVECLGIPGCTVCNHNPT